MDHLRRVIDQISLGRFLPSLTIEATTQVTHDDRRVAILVTVDVVDALHQDDGNIRLHECSPVPIDLLDPAREIALVRWIHERCQDVILHELDEFFRYRGKTVVKAAHPVTEETFADVRARASSHV